MTVNTTPDPSLDFSNSETKFVEFHAVWMFVSVLLLLLLLIYLTRMQKDASFCSCEWIPFALRQRASWWCHLCSGALVEIAHPVSWLMPRFDHTHQRWLIHLCLLSCRNCVGSGWQSNHQLNARSRSPPESTAFLLSSATPFRPSAPQPGAACHPGARNLPTQTWTSPQVTWYWWVTAECDWDVAFPH